MKGADTPHAAASGRLFPAWQFELSLSAAVMLAAGALHLLGFSWSLAWLLALVPYLGRHLWLFIRLASLIHQHHRLAPPFPHGWWGEIYRTIARYQQRGRKSRKRQLRFIRRFREAAHSLPDALVVLDKGKRIEWANPAAATLMGVHWPRDDGRKLSEVFRYPQLDEYIGAGDYARPIEMTPEHNQTLTLSVRIAPFGERKKQRLVVGRDITKIFHLNSIRRDFIANASHELRTPLTVISGFLEQLSDSPLTPESHRRPLELMRNQAQRMRSIVEDLLTLSRLELEREEGTNGVVRVAEEIRAIVAEARALSGDQHLFTLTLDEGLGLHGQQSELHSAFSNLVFNAVKHTPPGTRVEVFWGEDAQGPCFSVRDNGPGIAAEHLPRLSERFYRIDKARSRASGGTGLGLAIVKHALHRHDAELSIASEVGVGSVFACHFPPTRAARPPVNAPNAGAT